MESFIKSDNDLILSPISTKFKSLSGIYKGKLYSLISECLI